MRKILLSISAALLALCFTAPAHAITNGEPDGTRHPYVGLAVFDVDGAPAWRCSASLLSPTVVLTAGHCTDGADAVRVWFDADLEDNTEYPYGGATSYEGTPYTYPVFSIGAGNGLPGFAYRDVGVVVLEEPVPAGVVGEYAQLPEPGVVDTLAPMTLVESVGYGVQTRVVGEQGPPRWTGDLVRMYGRSQLVSGNFVHADEFLRLTANPAQGKSGVCFGDSGGPNLLGRTDTVLGVNSYVTNSNCRGVTYSQRIDIPEVLAWIEGFLV